MGASNLTPQQEGIVKTLDESLFVSAGAGSGKTFTLTQRIIWALSDGSGPDGMGAYLEHLDQALIITFTNKAASEIRERVRAALLDAGMEEEALRVDDSWISTIHHMCLRILKAHALELGIDPEFTVVEGADAEALEDKAIDHVLDRSNEDDGQDAYKRLFSWYDLVGETSIHGLVRELLDLASAAPDGFDSIELVPGKIDFSGLADAYRSCLDATSFKLKAHAVAADALAAIDAFEASAQTSDELAACMLACTMPSACTAFPKEEVDLLRAEAADAFVNAWLAIDAAAAEELLELAREVFDEYEQLKAERSELDNNDLLRLTSRALRDNESVRNAYAGRFKLVMVDEFQDTDQQQVDIIKRLISADEHEFCTVGDAQQSIYRFRGADVEVFRRQQRELERGGAGQVKKLTRNFRSHPQILECVARIFDDAQGGIMPQFLDLEPDSGRRDGLVAVGASRRQAVFVAGGSSDDRTRAKAAEVARRFRALAYAGQPVGDMVLLLGKMTHSDIYAQAFRDVGLDCVIAGGSVFSQAPEVKAVRALACTLANPHDTAQGLAPLLQSPMFALGGEEFLALSTKVDGDRGGWKRRDLYEGLMSDDDMEGLEGLPLLERARTVLRRALGRVGRDSFTAIARDVVDESGWMVRLQAAGPEGRAQAANILKALDALEQAEQKHGNAPRAIANAFDVFLEGKEAPGALNVEAENAVRIMTVHASKGLEFPVVAVAECFSSKKSSNLMQTRRLEDGRVEVVTLPDSFANAHLEDGRTIERDAIKKQFNKYLKGSPAWLTSEQANDVCASDSAALAWLEMRDGSNQAEFEEQKRLLYVACTRAREVLVLAMDACVGSKDKVPVLTIDDECNLTGRVLGRILPEGAGGVPRLDADHLAFEGSQPGDYTFICLKDFMHLEGGTSYEANATVEDGVLMPLGEEGAAADEGAGETPPVPGEAQPGAPDAVGEEPLDTFTLVWPKQPAYRTGIAPAPRVSYSYSSIAKELHAEGEDRAPAPAQSPGSADGEEESEDDSVIVRPAERSGSAVALGSAFHAAAQWMVETGSSTVPAARVDALARYWKITPEQRERLDAALRRWCGSSIRAEALSWPCMRAEVPFYSLGAADLVQYGEFAEGAIDLLCTDPADRSRALVIDYKTGGSPDETPDELQEKHRLQAGVYADALHKAGYGSVSLRFVRVEIDDPERPGQPQVVSYEL